MARSRRPPRPGALADLSPLRILTQIVVLQCAYYVSASVLLLFTALTAGKPVSVDLLLLWEHLRGDITEGWMYGLVWMLNAIVTVVPILILVARSKLVPDFALTIHLLHLILTSWYSHAIPTNLFWWGLQATSASLMIFLGMWSCQWRELRPISFGGSSSNKGSKSADMEASAAGKERAGGRDGGGVYEMLSTKEQG